MEGEVTLVGQRSHVLAGPGQDQRAGVGLEINRIAADVDVNVAAEVIAAGDVFNIGVGGVAAVHGKLLRQGDGPG